MNETAPEGAELQTITPELAAALLEKNTRNRRIRPHIVKLYADQMRNDGEPTFKGRVWNAEHELWIAVDCSCNAPEQPTCPNLIPLIAQAVTVREIVRVCKAHRQSCPLCGPVEIRRPSSKEPAQIRKEAA